MKKVNLSIRSNLLIPEIRKLLDDGHTVTLPLKGTSMRPFLEGGRDKAVLVKPGKCSVGGVVLAETSSGKYVLHRIIKVEGDRMTLLGDGNITPETCYIKDVYAKATAFYRGRKGRLYKTDGLRWKVYSSLWMRLRPVRRLLLYVYRLTIK